MVNCFLTCSPTEKDPVTGHDGYRISASKLDFRRLNKEITEAHQILTLIESFHVLGKMFDHPVPSDYKCHAWIRKIKKQYDTLPATLFLHQGKYYWHDKKNPKPKKLKYDEQYTVNSKEEIIYKGKTYPKFYFILPGDNFFSLGFWSHPMVIMYMNYPDSLKMYINSHIQEFVARGGKAGVIKRICKIRNENVVHPPWALDPNFHENHKAALLCKEIARNEPAHYIKFRDFKVAYNNYLHKVPTNPGSQSDFSHYLWPFSQDLENPVYI